MLTKVWIPPEELRREKLLDTTSVPYSTQFPEGGEGEEGLCWGTRRMAVTLKSFNKYTVPVEKQVGDSNDLSPPFEWKVSAPFCCMRFLNDFLYLLGDGPTGEKYRRI